MIPYIDISDVALGPLTIHVWGALAALGMLVGYVALRRRLRHSGADSDHVAGAVFWALVGFALGAVLLHVAAGAAASQPGQPLRTSTGGAAYGGLVAGVTAGWLYLRHAGIRGVTLVRVLDAMAFVLPRGWIFLRLGCALVHDHPGIATDSWLGVQFPGGTRFDLGLLELLFTVAFLVMLAVFDRMPRAPGFYCGLVLLAYGVCRLFLEPLGDDPQRYFGLTINLYFSIAATALGIAVLALSRWREASERSLPQPGR